MDGWIMGGASESERGMKCAASVHSPDTALTLRLISIFGLERWIDTARRALSFIASKKPASP